MVMAPAPGTRAPRLRKFSVRCLLGRHDVSRWWVRIADSRWYTVGEYCRRCLRVMDVYVEDRKHSNS